jgi:hypothetical protein
MPSAILALLHKGIWIFILHSPPCCHLVHTFSHHHIIIGWFRRLWWWNILFLVYCSILHFIFPVYGGLSTIMHFQLLLLTHAPVLRSQSSQEPAAIFRDEMPNGEKICSSTCYNYHHKLYSYNQILVIKTSNN